MTKMSVSAYQRAVRAVESDEEQKQKPADSKFLAVKTPRTRSEG